jgi:hypothetical protein
MLSKYAVFHIIDPVFLMHNLPMNVFDFAQFSSCSFVEIQTNDLRTLPPFSQERGFVGRLLSASDGTRQVLIDRQQVF